jgi:hypothetical protein
MRIDRFIGVQVFTEIMCEDCIAPSCLHRPQDAGRQDAHDDAVVARAGP